jgi:hypothetical protein
MATVFDDVASSAIPPRQSSQAQTKDPMTARRKADGVVAQDPLLFQLLNEAGILAQLSQNSASRLLAPELNMSQFIVWLIAQPELPFGGVGESSMGACHGRWGFETFSKPTAVDRPSRFNIAGLRRPPVSARMRGFIDFLFRHS